jgi:hypothetical protein
MGTRRITDQNAQSHDINANYSHLQTSFAFIPLSDKAALHDEFEK